MKKNLICALMGITVLLMAGSCGKKSHKADEDTATTEVKNEAKSYILTADSVINGELRDYFGIVVKEYTLTDEGSGNNITVQFTTKKTFPESMGEPEFEIQLFDANGNLIGSDDASSSDMEHLIGSAPGETNAIKFDYIHLDSKDAVPVSFKILSKIDKPDQPTASASNSSSTTEAASTSSSSYDSSDSYDDSDDDGSVKSKAKKGWNRVKETGKAAWDAGKEAWKNR